MAVADKKRYLHVAIQSEQPLDEKEARELAQSSIITMLGDAGAAKAGFQFKLFEPKAQHLIVKCKHNAVTQVQAALALARKWQGRDVALRVTKASGTIAGLSR